jgi:hypothetical protein
VIKVMRDRRAWRTGAREIEGGIARWEGYVVSVGRGLSCGWRREVSGGRLKDTRLVEGGRVGTGHGRLATVRGLGLGVLAVVYEVCVRASERVIARRDGGGEDWEECKPFRQASRWPKDEGSSKRKGGGYAEQ